MRLHATLIAAAGLLCLALAAPTSADAGYRRAPAGWGQVQTVRHYGYYPRYRNVYATAYVTDPYAYGGRYVPPGYYAYYNSGYWRPGLDRPRRWGRPVAYGRFYGARGYPYGPYAAARWGNAYRPY